MESAENDDGESSSRPSKDMAAARERLADLMIAAKRRQARAVDTIVARADMSAPVAASHSQERLWFIERLGITDTAYNIAVAFRLQGELNEIALERSLLQLIKRHAMLRTRFVEVEGLPWQLVESASPFRLERQDISDIAEPEDCEQRLQKILQSELKRRFRLTEQPLFHVVLVRMSPGSYALLFTFHHIVADGWSISILCRELSQLYSACIDERAVTFPEVGCDYADFSIWQKQRLQGDFLERRLDYWRRQLADTPPQLQLPTDRPRQAVESFNGAAFEFLVPETLQRPLERLARDHGATLFMLMLAAYQLVLSRYSGQDDVVVGTPVAGRHHPDVEGLVGCFVNTLAIRTRVSEEQTFVELLKTVKEATLEAFAHEDLPFELLVKDLQPERTLTHQPIFQVMLAMQNYGSDQLELSGVSSTWITPEYLQAHCDLTLYILPGQEKLSGRLEYSTDLFDRATVERMAGNLLALLQNVVDRPRRPLYQVSSIQSRERSLLLREWNSTERVYPRDQCVHDLFADQVRQTPGKVALISGERTVTYEELNEAADRLAWRLVAQNTKPENPVGVHLPRSVDLIVAFLGILKAGLPYLPIDPCYPAERARFMLEEAGASTVVTLSSLTSEWHGVSIQIVLVDDLQSSTSRRFAARHVTRADNLAYILYTSGSTGRPKAVGVIHRNITRLLYNTNYIRLNSENVLLLMAPAAFDASTFEIWGALLFGGTLVLYPDSPVDLDCLEALIVRYRVDVLWLTAGLFHQVADERPQILSKLKWLLSGGDVLSAPHARQTLESSPGMVLINAYGPTETTTFATCHILTDARVVPDSVPIGKPIANTRVYVLDRWMHPAPIGVGGELYIAGDGVARGYMNRPELTCDRFVANPFDEQGARLYRTGDWTRWTCDGDLEFLGRRDGQVKIRGYRIEPGEIEAELRRSDHVKDVVVVVSSSSSRGKTLVAYVVPRPDELMSSVELAEMVGAGLKEALPAYMIPMIVIVDQLPLTPNGKIDRRALPAFEKDLPNAAYESPVGPQEAGLAEIWKSLLSAPRVGRDDNFFDLGGHSLLVLKLLHQIRQSFGKSLRGIDVYQNPNIRRLAALLQGQLAATEWVDLTKEAILDETIRADVSALIRIPPQKVLLTGATGFVGRFLLRQLLEDTEATVYCLVRADSGEQARRRLQGVLSESGLWNSQFERRVVAVSGDLRSQRLGLDDAMYAVLSGELDSIYHCGTSMNHLETYAMARLANVSGVVELLRLACLNRPKVVNYISTASIFSPGSAEKPRCVSEVSVIDEQQHLAESGYAASKWVGEKLVLLGGERGIPWKIYRLGLVWADSALGRNDPLQQTYRLLKSCLMSGYGIRGYRYDVQPLPVDYICRAIVHFSTRVPNSSGVFHLSSEREMTEGIFECVNELQGLSLQLLPYYEWLQKIRDLHNQGRSLPAVPLVEHAFSMSEAAYLQYEAELRRNRINIESSRSRLELQTANIFEPSFDGPAIRRAVLKMISSDPDLQNLKAVLQPGLSS